MRDVKIIPTYETKNGNDNKYDIISVDNNQEIHMSIKQVDLKGIIEANDYNVTVGSTYL